MKRPVPMLMLLAILFAGAGARGQEAPRTYYVVGNLGGLLQADSDNSGRFTEAFDPQLQDDLPGTELADAILTEGAAYIFETSFDPGIFASLAVGKTTPFGPFRSEFELSYTRAAVDQHQGFRALGTLLDGLDAEVLLGEVEPGGTGLTLSEVLEDGQGRLRTFSAMINGFWDLPVPAEDVSPYLGFGLGAVRVEAEYRPSGFLLIDDAATAAGYQLMAGFDYAIGERYVLHVGYRYRGTTEVEFDTEEAILPSEIDIDVSQSVLEIGYRIAL